MSLHQVRRSLVPWYCDVHEVSHHYFQFNDIHGTSAAKLFRDPLDHEADYTIGVNALSKPELHAMLQRTLDSACRYISQHGWTAFRQSGGSA